MWNRFLPIAFLLAAAALPAAANTIIVGPSSAVKNIEDGLRLAHDGDTIWVKKGQYAAEDLVVDKAVVLMGENYPVLDGRMKGNVLVVRANRVAIKGFHIRNTNKGSLKNYAGVVGEKVTDITIEDNKFDNTLFPVYLPKTRRGTVKNNLISGNSVTGKNTSMESGSGIYLWYASDITVEANKISGQRDGIYFEFSTGCTVTKNVCEDNYRYGLHFMFSNNNTYTQNLFRRNGSGVAVMYSKHIVMRQNRFEHNWGPAAYGLLLKEINDSRIDGNIFQGNTTGVFMESSNRNRFSGNDFSRNGWAMNVLSDCTEDSFYHNNFTGNTFDISTNGDQNQNSFRENYWDKYTGYDLNKDGKGDVPYHPVSLYSKIIENIPYAIILLRSFVVDLLDKAEQAVPSLIPSSVADHYPLMKYKNYDRNL